MSRLTLPHSRYSSGKWPAKAKRLHFRGSGVPDAVMTPAGVKGLTLNPSYKFAHGSVTPPGVRMTLKTPPSCPSGGRLGLDTCTLPIQVTPHPLWGNKQPHRFPLPQSGSGRRCPPDTQEGERNGSFLIHSSALIPCLRLTGEDRPGKTALGVASDVCATGRCGRNADQPGKWEWESGSL